VILAIETATDVCGVALVHEQKVVASQSVKEKNVHSERLLPMVDAILSEASVAIDNVEAFAVSIGPGSFTGLRIGLSTAKGLALARRKPIIAVPTLDALAFGYFLANPDNPDLILCPLIDAKRDEAFFCFFKADITGVHRLSEYGIAAASKIIESADGYDAVVFVGDGVKKVERLRSTKSILRWRPEIVCDPTAVGMLAENNGVKLSAAEISTLEPFYLRDFAVTHGGGKKTGTLRSAAALETNAHSFEG
jgi:tRNA threonylcarbamoyladenosine biosynthesis protein TsaB